MAFRLVLTTQPSPRDQVEGLWPGVWRLPRGRRLRAPRCLLETFRPAWLPGAKRPAQCSLRDPAPGGSEPAVRVRGVLTAALLLSWEPRGAEREVESTSCPPAPSPS